MNRSVIQFTGALVLAASAQLASAAPASLVQSVTYDGETVTLRLTRQDLRGANFELCSQNATGGYDVIIPVAERSYLGTVDGYPGAVSCGIQLDSGVFKGAIYFDRGETWFTLGTSVVETRALGYGSFSAFDVPASPTVAAGQGGATMYAYELGVDVDYNYFSNGGSIAGALEGIEYSVCLVRAIYMRDVLLRPYLGRVIVRSTLAHDPYTGLTQGNYLDAVRLEWNNNHTDTNPDLVCGASPTKIGGGLAWVGVVGTGSGYSVNQSNSSGNFDVVFRHEMGHNWDCGHYVGGSPEGTGLMGGNAAGRFSGPEAYRVLNHRTAKIGAGIVDSEGTYTGVELPPYASMDVGEFVQTISGPLAVDVLANDHDANGQALSLSAYDGASARGGTVSQQGANLVYTPPGSYLGTDYFTYTVADSAGRSAMGVAVISVQPDDALRLFLPLDETTGTDAADQSAFANTGSLSGTDFDTSSVAGRFGNAVSLDGVDDAISVSGVRLNANTVTLTAWIKPGATSNPWSGILFDRSGGAAGLNIGAGTELRYHWNDSPNTYNWNSHLSPAPSVWTFVALVVEPHQATIFMNSGTGFQSATNPITHAPAGFGTTYIGRDPGSGSRYFNGAIDDARVYNLAMTQAQLQNLYEGGGAESPQPYDGATGVTLPVLRWSGGVSATAFDVYVGTSQAAVAAATQASPEFRETTTDRLHVATLADQTTHYWRIDSATASSTLTGRVWSFTTGTVLAPANSILVNFEENSNQQFAGGELIGPTSVDSAYWNAGLGASGSLNDLVNSIGVPTAADVAWDSLNTWSNNDGTGDDEHRLSTGYLDDGNSGSGNGVTVTLSDIPFVEYRVYGLFATDQNGGGSSGTVNFNVNGAWALGGNASTTAPAWGSIGANHAAHGEYWTEIVPGSVQGNYWTVETSGATCTIVGELRNGGNRGCLTAVIIEDMGGAATTNAPTWNTSPVQEVPAEVDVAYTATLADDAGDLEGDPLTFAKVDGPAWLDVAANGALSGTPAASDSGTNGWTVSVTDGFTAPVEETLEIVVVSPVDILNPSFELPNAGKLRNWESVPGWSSDSVAADSGVETGEGATDGLYTGFLWSGDPSVWHRTDPVIGVGDTYTLRIDARDTGGASSLRVQLYYDDAGARVPVATLDAAVTGGMQEFVLPFSAADVPAAIGHRIGIELSNVAGGWVGFDHLRLTRTPAPDTDGDGMPDTWEVAHSLDPLVDDRAGNPDGDANDNWSEYVSDTDPQDPDSHQTFSVEWDSDAGVLLVRFSTSAARNYAVETRDDLTSGDWQGLGPALPGTGAEMTVPDPAVGSRRYHRLRIELP